MLLPAILQGTQLSHFFWIASVIRGHQKCLAAIDILFIAGWPLCKRLIIVVLRFFGTMILSSKKTSPYLEDNFFLYMEYSSGMLSCCCRSRHTSVLSRLGSLVVSVINNCRSVANCFSVSLTAFPKSQLFCSTASTLGACPIFIYWTLFTPTYLAQLIAGTSSTDGSCSDPDPISPSSIGVHCCCPGGGVLSVDVKVCGRPLLVSPFLWLEAFGSVWIFVLQVSNCNLELFFDNFSLVS